MRLLDHFIDTFLLVRKLEPGMVPGGLDFDELQRVLIESMTDAEESARSDGFSEDQIDKSRYAVVAFIDEVVLCSDWDAKQKWQNDSLQRRYFQTTNIGSGFYEKLNELAKHGPDSDVREVFVMCTGLGFKGRYFSNEDRRKLEEIKGFNLGMLLPEEAQRNLDTATLFPSAYGDQGREEHGFKRKIEVIRYVVAASATIIIGLFIYYDLSVRSAMQGIVDSVLG